MKIHRPIFTIKNSCFATIFLRICPLCGQAHFNQAAPRRGRRGWPIFYRLHFAIYKKSPQYSAAWAETAGMEKAAAKPTLRRSERPRREYAFADRSRPMAAYRLRIGFPCDPLAGGRPLCKIGNGDRLPDSNMNNGGRHPLAVPCIGAV